MSSDSDTEEFFDAQDVTPARVNRFSHQEETEQKQFPGFESKYLEVPPKPPRMFLEESEDTFQVEKSVLSLAHAHADYNLKEDASIFSELKENADNLELGERDSSEAKYDLSDVTTSSQPNISDSPIHGVGDSQNDLSDPINESVNIDLPENKTEKLLHKNIPVVIPGDEDASKVEISADPPTGDDNVEIANNVGLEKPEPDIVQSVKPRPAVLPPPKAPPRKKRMNKAPVPPNIHTENEQRKSTLQVKGLPTGLPTPTSTVYNITKDLEQSLDIQSATSGTCIVTAKEEASAKAEAIPEEVETMSQSSNETRDSEASSVISPSQTASEKPEENEENKMRPRTNSGSRFLTDKEILDMVSVLNLDTGEKIPLSAAEEKLPQGVNPLSLHIMRRTKEYSSDSSLHKTRESDDENKEMSGTQTIRQVKMMKKKTTKIKKFLGKTVHRIRTKADGVLHGENEESDEEDENGRRMIKVKASSSHKGPYDFDLLVPVQDLGHEHNGAIWTMKFSHCGRLLATGGQDNLLRIWVLKNCSAYFDDMRQKYSEATKVSPAPSQDSLNSQGSQTSEHSKEAEEEEAPEEAAGVEEEEDEHAPFMRRPFCIYRGHTADLLDLSWSKNYFILSSSMDKTVRLWHISRKECLCCFQHIDFVTAIAFHPRDDRYFLSGSLDGKLRLWNIPDKKVALWNEVMGQSKLITAANFCLNGRFAVVGTYDGRCIFYSTEQLKYYTQIHVRSTRGRNARGRKITGVEPLPGKDKVMVTSNDSRIRLYDLRDLTLTCKYKGCANNSSQIKASFNHDGKYIICGSEDHFAYIWRTQHEFYKYSSARRDRNDFWEGIKAHTAVVTAAIFAPNPGVIVKPQFEYIDSDNKELESDVRAEVLVSADFSGAIKVFINKFKPGSG